VARTPEKIAHYLKKEELALYELIWKRFVACQMSPAQLDQTIMEIVANGFTLRASGTVLRFPGFMRLYIEGSDNDEADSGDQTRIPDLSEGSSLRLLDLEQKQHFTQPPPRFTEASLIRELEEKGIGRPSTYASIMGVIQKKEYTTKEKGRFKPTELGMLVNDLLVSNFPVVLNVAFTAELEAKLDQVESGSQGWLQVIEEFYQQFHKAVEKAHIEMIDVKREGVPTDIECEQCGKKMYIRWGKNGLFLSCSGYPDCKNSKNFVRDDKGRIRPAAEGEVRGKCELCGRDMVVKEGRFGTFLACTGYPECKNTRSLQDEKGAETERPVQYTDEICDKCGGRFVIRKGRGGVPFLACENYPRCRNTRPISTGVACPQEGCDGEVVERVSKKGRRFYGCSRFPKCRYVSWSRPVDKQCPRCGHSHLVVRKSKGDEYLACPVKSCGYKEKRSSEA
jgi:DNA topoisomerase-1